MLGKIQLVNQKNDSIRIHQFQLNIIGKFKFLLADFHQKMN